MLPFRQYFQPFWDYPQKVVRTKADKFGKIIILVWFCHKKCMYSVFRLFIQTEKLFFIESRRGIVNSSRYLKTPPIRGWSFSLLTKHCL